MRRDFREAEVEDLRVSAPGDKNVGRLDIAMDDAAGVRRIERVGDLDAEREQFLHRHGLAADFLLQRHAVEELHGDEGLAVVLADVVDGADIRMIEGGGGLGLAQETGPRLGVLRDTIGQQLQSHKAVQTRVLGFVNDAHAATAEPLDDAVVRDGLVQQGSLRKTESVWLGGRDPSYVTKLVHGPLICGDRPSRGLRRNSQGVTADRHIPKASLRKSNSSSGDTTDWFRVAAKIGWGPRPAVPLPGSWMAEVEGSGSCLLTQATGSVMLIA